MLYLLSTGACVKNNIFNYVYFFKGTLAFEYSATANFSIKPIKDGQNVMVVMNVTIKENKTRTAIRKIPLAMDQYMYCKLRYCTKYRNSLYLQFSKSKSKHIQQNLGNVDVYLKIKHVILPNIRVFVLKCKQVVSNLFIGVQCLNVKYIFIFTFFHTLSVIENWWKNLTCAKRNYARYNTSQTREENKYLFCKL